MSTNYAKPIPFDRNGVPLQEFPTAASAIGITAVDNFTVSSIINLNANTTVVEIAAIGSTAFIKWQTVPSVATITGSVISLPGTANFDNTIPVNTYRKFVVPRVTASSPSIQGLNTMEGLFNAVAVKTAGAGSVLLTEY